MQIFPALLCASAAVIAHRITAQAMIPAAMIFLRAYSKYSILLTETS